MGCDIHFYVEHFQNNKWKAVNGDPIDCPYSEPGALIPWFDDRDYALFSQLAGVRGPFVPWSKPRGLPWKISSRIKKEYKKGEIDAHSTSYFTLSEILEQKDQIQTLKVKITAEGFQLYLKNKLTYDNVYKYAEWSPTKSTKISNKEMKRILDLGAFIDEKYSTDVVIKLKNKESSDEFWNTTIPRMSKLNPDPNKVRCVFWFDN